MKTPRPIWIAAAVAALAMSVRTLPTAPEPTSDASDRFHPLPWVQRLQAAAADLGLTEEQPARLRELFEANRDQVRAVWTDPTLSREEKQEKLRALCAKLEPELQQMLTPEQREKGKQRLARPSRPTSTRGHGLCSSATSNARNCGNCSSHIWKNCARCGKTRT